MLVFSGSLGPSVSPLSKRNEKQTRNRLGDEGKPLCSCINHTIWEVNTEGIIPEKRNLSWRTRNDGQILIPNFSLGSVLIVIYEAFRSTNKEHLISSGLKQELGDSVPGSHSRSIYLESNLNLWNCSNQACMIQSSCRLWDNRVLCERISKPLSQEVSEDPNEVLECSPSHRMYTLKIIIKDHYNPYGGNGGHD